MAKTPTDRIIEMSTVLAALEARLGHCDDRVADLARDHKEGGQIVSERCKQYELEISHLRRDIEDLKKWKAAFEEDQKDTKKWHRSFGPNIVAAVLTIFLAPLSVLIWNWFSARLQAVP
jgi:hypothetical protein